MQSAATTLTKKLDPQSWRGVAIGAAIASGAFCALICVLLLINHFQSLKLDPLDSPEITAMKTALQKNPGDEQLKQQIRALDLKLRQELARHLALGKQGAWLLISGAAVFLVSLKTATYKKRLPRPPRIKKPPGAHARASARARWAVAVLAVMSGGAALILSSFSSSNIEGQLAKLASEPKLEPAAPAMPLTPFPAPEEISRNWPRFRGPGGLGVSTYTNLPAMWDAKTGAGILWKVVVPISGVNSPILWDNRLFLTGATKTRREVYCYDALSGKLLWQRPVQNVPGTSAETPTVMEDAGGYAAATAATDGRRVYAIFANGDLAAFDYVGRLAWARNLGLPDNSYGHASSLETYRDRLIVLLDQGDGKDGKSKLLALDTATGQTVWESSPRPVPSSWATPITINTSKGDQIITCANPWVIAYEPTNGAELWRAKALYGEVTPSPIFADGMVFTAIESEKLSAIRPDGSGNVTDSHIVWSAEDGLPDICSPLSDGERVYLLNTYGAFTCYNAKTGDKLWEKELELGFHSSPSLAGNRIYLFGDEGLGLVLEAGLEFKELGRFDLGEQVMSSPAFADGRIYIRAKQHLFCIVAVGTACLGRP